MDLVQLTLNDSNRGNSLVAFCDNASAIRGVQTQHLIPSAPGQPSALTPKSVMTNISFTAETHNFPTGIAPFQGATTGVGGRIRDTQAIGRGGLFVAGTAGYCVGPLDSVRFDRVSPMNMLLRARYVPLRGEKLRVFHFTIVIVMEHLITETRLESQSFKVFVVQTD